MNLVIYGVSGHARVVIDAARRGGTYGVVGLLADGSGHPDQFAGLPVIGNREVLGDLRKSGCACGFIAVGENQARLTLANLMEDAGFTLVSIIHPSATIADDVEIGKGVFIAAGAVINPGARIGDLAIVNTSSSVDHDCTVERLAHVSPGVRLGGHALICEGAWIGIGATVLDRRVVGAWSIVGGGGVVTCDVPPGRKFVGVPALDIGPSGATIGGGAQGRFPR